MRTYTKEDVEKMNEQDYNSLLKSNKSIIDSTKAMSLGTWYPFDVNAEIQKIFDEAIENVKMLEKYKKHE